MTAALFHALAVRAACVAVCAVFLAGLAIHHTATRAAPLSDIRWHMTFEEPAH